MMSSGPVRIPIRTAPVPGPAIHVNPYMGTAGYASAGQQTPRGSDHLGGAPPQTNQINPVYYNQLGAVPGDTITEKTGEFFFDAKIDILAECFDRLPDGRIKWFAGPPLDVLEPNPIVHSIDYMAKKATEEKKPAVAAVCLAMVLTLFRWSQRLNLPPRKSRCVYGLE